MIFQIPKNRQKFFLRLSILILVTDVVFVVINYVNGKETLIHSQTSRAVSYKNTYLMQTENVYRNMMQLATYIGNLESLNALFMQGKNAVEAEGGGQGGELANQARQKLLAEIKPAWDIMMEKFSARQLHYHLGPGSTSFLRVHEPEKYGDTMHDIRHIIVDTNKEKTPRYGFEIGRFYSGLRAVVPIWFKGAGESEQQYVGALEVGTSFEQPLKLVSKAQGFDLAVFLDKAHVEEIMWEDYVNSRFSDAPSLCNSYLKTSSFTDAGFLPDFINMTNKQDVCMADELNLVEYNDNHYFTYLIPLFDYQSQALKSKLPVGFTLIVKEINDEIAEFNSTTKTNIIFAIIGFLLIELALIYSLRLEERVSRLKHHSIHDALTGINNRRHYEETLEQELVRAKRNRYPTSLIYLDLDRFKNYNDSYGHPKGDECLKKVATEMKNNLQRASDFLARIGGEEFAVILPNTDINKGKEIAEHLRNAVEQLNIEHENNKPFGKVTISLGLVCTQESTVSVKNLVNGADRCLYEAKGKGRNTIVSEQI